MVNQTAEEVMVAYIKEHWYPDEETGDIEHEWVESHVPGLIQALIEAAGGLPLIIGTNRLARLELHDNYCQKCGADDSWDEVTYRLAT